MHHEMVKALIRMAGTTPSAIAAELGITAMTVSHVIRGNGKSARVALRISEVTGKSTAELFPGRYPELETATPGARTRVRRKAEK